ncbi:GNAT family protein [Halobacillus rhizosphaerae]|uniref:GNAT family N-acetyltransferase n=1 Tax=Halobacillus rhizosphaerae TaxID=3064889 RepID=UPI00398B15BB
MTYIFEGMTQEQAELIARQWHYDGKYAFYDMEADEEDLKEFLDPIARGNSKYTITQHQELTGFISVNQTDPQTCDIGLGMRPDLTGKGLGTEFLKEGMEFVKYAYQPKKITLSVATFNQRAIKVYHKLGFEDGETFWQDTNDSSFEFLKMTYQ